MPSDSRKIRAAQLGQRHTQQFRSRTIHGQHRSGAILHQQADTESADDVIEIVDQRHTSVGHCAITDVEGHLGVTPFDRANVKPRTSRRFLDIYTPPAQL